MTRPQEVVQRSASQRRPIPTRARLPTGPSTGVAEHPSCLLVPPILPPMLGLLLITPSRILLLIMTPHLWSLTWWWHSMWTGKTGDAPGGVWTEP